MNVKLSILFILAYQVCVGQIHITESLKDQICFDTFGERIDEITIDEDGNELSSVLFPDNMVSIRSRFFGYSLGDRQSIYYAEIRFIRGEGDITPE